MPGGGSTETKNDLYPWLLATFVTVRGTVCVPTSSATPIEGRLRSLPSKEYPMDARKSQLPGVKIGTLLPQVNAA